MMKAARTASLDGTTDGKKDFMVLPGTHVTHARQGAHRGGHVAHDRRGYQPGPHRSRARRHRRHRARHDREARIALATFDGSGIPTLPFMGKNLMAHLRSNLVFRVPRTAIPGLSATINELQTAALFVKGRATRPNNDLIGRFHLQIAASGGASTVGGEDELFRKIPDVDFYRPAAQLHRHACGLRDPRPGRDGGGGSDQLRRASEPRGP